MAKQQKAAQTAQKFSAQTEESQPIAADEYKKMIELAKAANGNAPDDCEMCGS